LATDPLDELEDVFESAQLNVTALLKRYKAYQARLKAAGLNPWKEQPRRKDLHYTEAVGHFHLYHWLQNAIGRICVISLEFPTGNGKVDLHLKCGVQTGLIEVKSFTGALQLKEARMLASAVLSPWPWRCSSRLRMKRCLKSFPVSLWLTMSR